MKKSDFVELKPMLENGGISDWYAIEIRKMILRMTAVYEDEILNMYQDNREDVQDIRYAEDKIGLDIKSILSKLEQKIKDYFSTKSEYLARELVNRSESNTKSMFTSALNLFRDKLSDGENPTSFFSIKNGKIYSEIKDNIVKTTVFENVSLIKSIHRKYHDSIANLVSRTVLGGKSQKELSDNLAKIKQITKHRAKLIADDQCHKVHTDLSLLQVKSVGIKYGKWLHTGASKKARTTHRDILNGKIFELSKGLYDPAVKKFIMPSELPFCSCIFIPVIKLEDF